MSSNCCVPPLRAACLAPHVYQYLHLLRRYIRIACSTYQHEYLAYYNTIFIQLFLGIYSAPRMIFVPGTCYLANVSAYLSVFDYSCAYTTRTATCVTYIIRVLHPWYVVPGMIFACSALCLRSLRSASSNLDLMLNLSSPHPQRRVNFIPIPFHLKFRCWV